MGLQMTKLTFFGGVNEIGGNKILLEDDKTRVFLDFGKSFAIQNKFFDEYLRPRKLNMIDELVSFGQIPRLAGIYREDYLRHVDENHPLLSSDGARAADAVLITHAHIDHIGMIPYLRPDIELFGSETSRAILRYWQDVSSGDESEFLDWWPSFQILKKERKPRKGRSPFKRVRKKQKDLKHRKETRDFTVVDAGAPEHFGDVEIHSFPVDHSLPGATAYVIKTSVGHIAYTGDLRLHGYVPEITERFINRLEDMDIKALLCEGTRVDEDKGVNESALEKNLSNEFDKTKGLILANYSLRDTSRISTIAKAAANSDRTLLLHPKQAYYLNLVSTEKYMPIPNEDDYEVLLPRKSWGIWSDSSIDEQLRRQDYSYTAKPVKEYMFGNLDLLTPEEVATNPDEYVVTCSFYDFGLLHDLQPLEGSSYIWSRSEPFDEEGEIEYERVQNWLSHFGIDEPISIHCSGHISGPEIRELIERAQPEMVIPIHTEHPEMFKDWHDDVRILQKNESIEL